MGIFRKIKEFLLYGGMDRERFSFLWPQVIDDNLALMRIYTWVGMILFLALSVFSIMFDVAASSNLITYILSFAAMSLLMAIILFVLPKRKNLVMPVLYAEELVIYLFSLSVASAHTEVPMVSAIVFLTLIPQLFSDKPVNMIFVTSCAVAITSAFALSSKSGSVLEMDIWNVLSFGVLGIFVNMALMKIKLGAKDQADRVVQLSNNDMLTGLRNRNCYESRINLYPSEAHKTIVCVYCDANGLHELNNQSGHHAGDEMLKVIAGEFSSVFGTESYRIGGDEFVGFALDKDMDWGLEQAEAMTEHICARGYDTSFGVAAGEKSRDIRELIKEAEAMMRENTRAYYSYDDSKARLD